MDFHRTVPCPPGLLKMSENKSTQIDSFFRLSYILIPCSLKPAFEDGLLRTITCEATTENNESSCIATSEGRRRTNERNPARKKDTHLFFSEKSPHTSVAHEQFLGRYLADTTRQQLCKNSEETGPLCYYRTYVTAFPVDSCSWLPSGPIVQF